MGAYVPDGRDLAAWLADGPRRAKAASEEEASPKGGSTSRSESPTASSTMPARSRLPLELILQIAQYLVEPLPHALPFASSHDVPVASSSSSIPSPTAISSHSALLPPGYNIDRPSYLAVLHLSSLSLSLRRLLAPLVWQQVLINRSDRLGKLRSLVVDYYQRLASSFSDVDRLLYPLPLVRVLRIEMPDRYLSFDQEILRHLLRSGLNASTGGLHTLVWDAEMLPSPAIWKLLGEGEKMLGLEAELQQRKCRTLDRDQIRALANSGRGEGMFYNPDHPRIRTARRRSGSRGSSNSDTTSSDGASKVGDIEVDDMTFESLSLASAGQQRNSRPPRPCANHQQQMSALQRRSPSRPPLPRGLHSVSINCKVFWSLHSEMSRLRSLQHLHLTSFDSHLLPPHLPGLLISLHRPLRSISLSSSKTSLLHDWDLIRRGVLSRLEWMDVYPVTPEWPLVQGLRSAARSLRGLRLILDVSGSFGNFDRLWRDLVTGDDFDRYGEDGQGEISQAPRRLGDSSGGGGDDDVGDDEDITIDESEATLAAPTSQPPHDRATIFSRLEWLVVDPFPQQNTAPSFVAFLETCCPSLKWLNGRRIDQVPKGLEMWDFDPQRISGAFPY
ncbi:hypothetical protein BDZ90DRAFT_258883 [Jaminaea rosea]|uniref:Uncharacterized protein n=1 Tax=Jaminaea rosea TaxID=1569628 RepID=A0A316UU26_9BASI|nr:hypothetical protein BDZ90DRAFT_258883 [Jaminaea rosea]PWN28807.1 hypothetical protein BDZ90DRAFT_258883 [Jaminaea rosea]